MTAASPDLQTPDPKIADPKMTGKQAQAWLKSAAGPWRRLTIQAGLLTLADVVPATGFALGLAMAIGRLETSLLAAAPWLGLALVSLTLRGLLAQRALLAGARTARAVKGEVRLSILTDLFAGRRRGAEAMTAAVEGVQALDGHYARFVPARLSASAAPLILIAIAAFASPVSAAILLFTMVPFIAGMILAGTAAAEASRRQFQALERLSGLFLDRIRALPAILAFQAETRTTADVARASTGLEVRTGKVLKIAFVSSAIIEFFSALSVALVAVYCGFNLLRLLPFPVPETLSLAQAFFVLALAPEVYAPMRRLSAAYHDRQAAEAAAASLMSENAPAVASPASVAVGAAPAIRFRSVAIAYEGGAPVVENFNLDIAPGEVVALTGLSGAGKSSLLHLLLGLAPLTSGEVEVEDIRQTQRLSEARSFAHAVAWASQTPVVVPGGLYDNIRIARPDASDAEVAGAAARAGLIAAHDRPIDERGGGLSGGERRRLGLARAFLSTAPILLLDEPTANLDTASEAEMIQTIREAAHGRTTLIATHSAAVMVMADVVVAL